MYGFPIEVKIRKSMWIMVVADEVPLYQVTLVDMIKL